MTKTAATRVKERPGFPTRNPNQVRMTRSENVPTEKRLTVATPTELILRKSATEFNLEIRKLGKELPRFRNGITEAT